MPLDLTKCDNVFCSIGVKAELTRFPFNKVKEQGFKTITKHTDQCGQIEPKPKHSENYFLTSIGYYTEKSVIVKNLS